MPMDWNEYFAGQGTWSPTRVGTGASVDVPATIAAGMVPYAGLTSDLNTLMTGEARAPYEANLPDYANLVAQRSANTGSMLRGEVPEDVRRQIINAGAERGIATGSPGSPNANAAWLQALGLTSIGLQQQGSANLSQSIQDTPVPQLFNPASLFVPQTLAADELRAANSGLASGARTRSGSSNTSDFWGDNYRQDSWQNYGFF